MANTFKFGNKQWYGKKGSVLAYNDENNNFKPLPFTFTRSSSATRVNKDGLIEVVGTDEPRVDYLNNADGHLLLEPSRTNLIPYSEEFSNSAWSKISGGTGSVPPITPNTAISPDGTLTASRIIFGLNGGTSTGDFSLLNDSVTVSSGATTTKSFYIKSNTSSNYTLITYDAGDPSLGSKSFVADQEWKRIDINNTVSSTLSFVVLGLRNFDGKTTSDYADVLIWGAQLEAGSYATSYIPTSGSSVTRAADNCSQTPASGVIGQTEGTLFIDFVYGGTSNTVSDNFNLTLGTWASNIMTIGQYGNALYARIYESSTLYFNQDYGNMTIGQRYKCAVGYAANNVSFYVNGSLVATDTSVNIPTVSNISLNRGTLENAKKINQVILHNTRLTNAELATLTS